MDLAAAFAQQFPLSSEYFALELVAETDDAHSGDAWGGVREMEGHLVATLRLIIWEDRDGARSICEVKEQQVVVVFQANTADARLPVYFEGWAAAIRYLFARLDERRGTDDELARLMPHELASPDVLGLRRPQTADEFTDALLSSKKRLGRLLP
ncbi:hypothetical protein [Nannocystis radixulma]|uniref:Transcriptional regulator n=1 Tax=Nannocystis radixulma TaxID=2995305 RepID=A0ABT5B579_9BACT|nr:hypothetical protein [Nannocystis radixulma]MDC0668211.1 hypothetical protein [Nannocystis radixulma]